MDVLSPEQRRRNMQAIRNKRTIIEELLAKSLWMKGLRYRRNNSDIFGNPDFSFRRYKLAIFCDSEFFHGKDWEINRNRIQTNVAFWHSKIESNIARDRLVSDTLTRSGWKVIRFWGGEIKKNRDFCVRTIIDEIEKTRAKIHGNQGDTENSSGEGAG